MRRSLVPILIVLGVAVSRAQQPVPAGADEAAIVEQSRTVIRYEDDGTGTRETYTRVKAQSEAGVQQLGQIVVGYSAATERVEFPLVRVRKPDGTTVDTPASAIQDLTLPVERIAPVYTDYHQKHVTVQSLRPGDTLEVRMVTTIHTPLAARHFWATYDFNEDAIVLDEQLDIDVPSARRIILKTQSGFEPTIKEAGGRRLYHWSHAHTVRKKDDADEADDKDKDKKKPAPDRPEPSDVRLTTFADWAEVGRWFSGVERTARAVTPEVRAKAAELTKGRATDLEKLEALYDFVSKNFRYVSLSLGIGRYQPRAAGDVLHDAYGDCKDKHTLLASLIDAAGFQASAVLINSKVQIDPDYPSPTQFDHVITRAVVGGQVVWLDATPEVAPFRLLSSSLRAKKALVADVEPARLEETPADPPVPSQGDASVDGAVDAAGTLTAKVILTMRGDAELPMRATFRALPAAQWTRMVEEIVSHTGTDTKLSDVTVADPQATHEPFTIAFRMESAGFLDWQDKKLHLRLPIGGTTSLRRPPETDPMPIGGPSRFTYHLTLRFPDVVKVRLPLPVSIVRDYADYRAQYGLKDALLTLDRRLAINTRELPDARRADLSSFLRVVWDDEAQTIGLDGAALPAAPSTPAVEAKKLSQTGYEALVARDYARAADMLKRLVELEPGNGDAWNNLGRAYMGLRQTDEAIGAYRKQIEVSPYHQYAYNNLGLAYAAKDRTAEAEAAYLKQLDVNPLDRYAHANLGALYLKTHAYDKAAAAFEKAATISPDEALLQVRLGKAYANLKQPEKAREAFSRAVELAPGPGIWNEVAYELALAGLDLDRAQQYAESAVSSVAAASRNLEIGRADEAAFNLVQSLAANWDTLGWVYFAKGDWKNAERFVAPAWKLSEHAEVGDHLGQIFEKLGRREDAVRLYAEALASPQPDAEIRTRLARVAGTSKPADVEARHRGNMAAARTFGLPAGPAGKKADFLVLFAAPGAVEAVRFAEGDRELEALADAIKKIPVAEGLFPDAAPARILRRGTVSCTDRGACALTLIVPDDARPLK